MQKLSEKLKGILPDEAYFVDASSLFLNPMGGEKEVLFVDTSTSPPEEKRETITKTSWGEIPSNIWTIRLYLDIDYSHKKEEIKQAFRKAIKGESKVRTHY